MSAPTQKRTQLPYAARVPGYLVGGGLMGVAEVIPGVSGGTVALVVGLYERLIAGADHVVRGVVAAVVPSRSRQEAVTELRAVHWSVIVPALVGMVTMVIVGASVIEPLREQYPVQTRALFFGLIAASVLVPLQMVGWIRSARDLLWIAVAAVAAFVLTGLPAASVEDPPLVAVGLAAAVAICALVLPGVSGSFFLEAVGLYDATISAVNDRDLGYLGVFALGAAIGLALFARVVRWLLLHRRRPTLLVMAGLMVGSLRALWPWQTETRGLLAPTGDVLAVLAFVVLGAAVVLALTAVDAVLSGRRSAG